MRRESERSRSMKGGLYVLAHITHPDCTWSCGYFRGHQLESIHGTDNVVGGFRHRGGAARAYFARRRWSAHFVISTVRGLFAVLRSSWKTGAMRANCKRSGNSPTRRKPPGSANSAHFWKGSWEGSGRKPRNQRWACWRNLKRLNASCARWSSSPEIRLPLTSGRLRTGLNVLPAGGFQRTLCERSSNYPRSTNNKLPSINRFFYLGSFSGGLLHT